MNPIQLLPAVRPIISTSLSKNGKQSKCKFTREDDLKLISLVMSRPERDWVWISQQMANRNPRQCRERWYNYLDPSLQKGGWTPEEDQLLIEKKKEMGPHWNAIARFFAGRSGNSVRNRWLLIMRHEEKNNTDVPEPVEVKIPPIIPAGIEVETEVLHPQTNISLDEKLDSILMPREDVNMFNTSVDDFDFLLNFELH
ncbi:Myb-like DNA-binding domain containing protein [Trichomonas vaginalis G3]|uniref:Myb-like DNA-binding domain containing protein n=1 Tax=Trichomonas vaginalis (strain ATCC PRA-98 / G3) TaxID=412133 RepID=A2F011_TRIV3|nr:RNA polymerase II transcription regulator recruiting protein [Trichomonas vaginalis G3]EAY01795.1 Myb-like DNA-binding domain containing protein [Trichomonas vaginalis G3]KAI5546823.1 RNA polymerase II transcription regulator recruiting protein [Trichomonas vaginalis G3]|eukprot:XP_001330421.1 Myb-like DNA-binding domain containing protein [Trichomonas vaginalis G3]